jgi:hypothetical protein
MRKLLKILSILSILCIIGGIFLYCNSFSVDSKELDIAFKEKLEGTEFKLILVSTPGYFNNLYSIYDIPFYIRHNPFRKNSSEYHLGIPPQLDEYVILFKNQKIKCAFYSLKWRVCYITVVTVKKDSLNVCREIKRLLQDKYPSLKIKVIQEVKT